MSISRGWEPVSVSVAATGIGAELLPAKVSRREEGCVPYRCEDA
ncbi:hypothetical protein ACLMAL_04270 [Nocardia sp. CWNU-33]